MTSRDKEPNPLVFPTTTDNMRAVVMGYSEGMRLRDYAATHVVAALVTNGMAPANIDHYAHMAYKVADAMLRVRREPTEEENKDA